MKFRQMIGVNYNFNDKKQNEVKNVIEEIINNFYSLDEKRL